MGTLYRPDGRLVWMMQYFHNGRRKRETTGEREWAKANDVMKNREAAVANGAPVDEPVGRITWETAADDLCADYTNNNKKSYDEVERRLRLHLTPYFERRRMASITASTIRAYVAKRKTDTIDTQAGSRPVSNAEINRELDVIKRMFTLAVQAGKLLTKPHIAKLDEHNVRTGFFEADQFEAVCKRLAPELAAVVRFAYCTGWRIDSEVITLEWPQVDFDARLGPGQSVAGTVRLYPSQTKTKEGRVLALTAELRALLLKRAAARDRLKKAGQIEPRVFFRMVADERGGVKKPKPIKRFNKAWANATTTAGCPGRIPHDLRRTAVRNFVRTGIPERIAMKMTGHKTRSVFERYNIVSDGDLVSAATMIDVAASRKRGRKRA